MYGRNIVAPLRKQAANRENKSLPKHREAPVYSRMQARGLRSPMQARGLRSPIQLPAGSNGTDVRDRDKWTALLSACLYPLRDCHLCWYWDHNVEFCCL